MVTKKPPYTHREIANAMFSSGNPSGDRRSIIPAWLKVEAYTLLFTVLPHVITLGIWAAIIAALYWALVPN